MLASGGADGKVRLWDIDTDTEIAVLQGPADFFARFSFSPDGKRSRRPVLKRPMKYTMESCICGMSTP